MTRRYFGTDGIRARFGSANMTEKFALKLAMAAGTVFLKSHKGDSPSIIIGRDTRESGLTLEEALIKGFASVGINVRCLGIAPTPAVALITAQTDAMAGVMISASHNPYHDNGIKFFKGDGYKLSDEEELQIEALIDKGVKPHDILKKGESISAENEIKRYIEAAIKASPESDLSGLSMVLDAAHGAAYEIARQILKSLGANVTTIGDNPDGQNINKDCGSTHIEALSRAVIDAKADIGIALDGDADRVILVDEKGDEIDGDQLIGVVASHWQALGKLKGDAVVATIMSNLGLEKWLREKGITLYRTKVGDRYVMEKMREADLNLGGEASGHIVLHDFATTGDGLVSALQALSVLKRASEPASAALRVFEPVPQKLINIRYGDNDPLERNDIQVLIQKLDTELGNEGRIVIRKSGTESVIRVMVEALEITVMEETLSTLVKAIKAAI